MDEEREGLDRPILRPANDFMPLLESNSPVMQRLLEKAKRAAASDATILLTGESGPGKDVLASALSGFLWPQWAICNFSVSGTAIRSARANRRVGAWSVECLWMLVRLLVAGEGFEPSTFGL